MTISYPLSLPAVSGRRSIRFRPRTVVAVSMSPWTGQRQVQVHPGQWWEADVTLPPMGRAYAEAWVAFLLSLNGPEGTFLMGDPVGATPRGVAGTTPGTPLVKGASQTGGALLFDGAGTGVTNYLRAGDWLQLGTGATVQLHKVLADASSNGSGEVTVDIWPDLRTSPADNAPITVLAAKGLFALPPGQAAEWNIDEAQIYGIAFSAQEALS